MSDEETKRARFWKLEADKAAIKAQSAPLRAQYDALVLQEADLHAQQRVFSDQFKAIEAPLYEIDMERARLARELGNKVGEPPSP